MAEEGEAYWHTPVRLSVAGRDSCAASTPYLEATARVDHYYRPFPWRWLSVRVRMCPCHALHDV